MRSGLVMKGISLFVAAGISAGAVPVFASDTKTASEFDPDTVLCYDEYAQDGMNVVETPSESWANDGVWDYAEVRALPVGNGRLGAMVYGKTDREQLQINESTVWSGGPHNYARKLDTPLTKDNIDGSLSGILSDGETLYTTADVYAKACELVKKGADAVAKDEAGEEDTWRNYKELATTLINKYFMGNELYQTSYQPFVDLYLNFGHSFDETQNYKRALDVASAVATVDYDYNGVHYSRETVASYPDQVIATNITADGGKLAFTASLDSKQYYEVSKVSDNELKLRGKVKSSGGWPINELPNAVYFDARVIIDTDGSVEYANDSLGVSGASYATVYVTGGTNYIDYKTLAGYETDENGNVITESCDEAAAYAYAAERSEAVKAHISGKSYADIKAAHLADYKSLYGRSGIDFSGDSKDADAMYRPTDERIAVFDGYNDLSLVKLYFNYGKYLLIASSRSVDPINSEFNGKLPTAQPSNLQGIWSWKTVPDWGSKYTANINVEMNYFMAQTANLGELEYPLFDAIEELAQSGKRTADTQYNINNGDSWVLHHNFDIWRGTAPVDGASSGMWPTGGAWLANHIWEYYEFNRDEDFLRESAYPVLKGAAEFFEKYLREYTDPASGETWLVSPASISPEHGDVQLSPTMDNSLIKNLLNISSKAANILGVDSDKTELWKDMAEKMPPYKKAYWGDYLREWLVDKADERAGDAEHRHPSQLWALHPGTEITPYDNTAEEQEIFDLFVKALERRGEGPTGWSAAWRICMWARAAQSDKAYSQMISLIKKATAPNMFDIHPPATGLPAIFQIDGNLGGAAGMIEMLMQSEEDDTITILPALPMQWRSGNMRGMKARGAHEVAINWTDGNAKEVTVKAGRDGDITVRYIKGVENAVVTNKNGDVSAVVLANKDKLTFNAVKGDTYTITGFTGTEYEPYVLREFALNDTMDTDEQRNSYSAYDASVATTFDTMDGGLRIRTDNNWTSKANGVRKDITEYIKSGREYEISADVTIGWPGETNAELFLEIISSGGNTRKASIAADCGSAVTLSGTITPEFDEGDTVYLCITHPCNYQIYDNVSVSYEPTGADTPISTPVPEEVDTEFEYLKNGDMESVNGNGAPNYWGARTANDSDSATAVSDGDAHGGSYSMRIADRASASSSAEYYTNNTEKTLEPGKTYNTGVWVKSDSDDTVNIKLRYDYWQDDTAASKAVKAGEWTYVSGSFTVRESGTLTQLIVDTTDTAADLRLDDASIRAAGNAAAAEFALDVSADGSYKVTLPADVTGDLYVAAYTAEGRLIAASTKVEGKLTNAAYIKAFLWEKDSMKPVENVIEKYIQ